MAENAELEALDHLVSSPGWTLFQDMVAKEWGTSEGGGTAFVSAVSNAAKAADADAVAHLRQIIAAQREIQKVMQLVPMRLKALKGVKAFTEDFIGSRRGTL